MAYLVMRPEYTDGGLTLEEVRAFLEDKVARWWLPDEVRVIEDLPKTSVGKLDKKRLRAEAAPLAGEVAGAAREERSSAVATQP